VPTLEDVLEAAIAFEAHGRDVYLEAADRVTDVAAESVLRALARDEDDHARVIRQYREALSRAGGGTLPEGLATPDLSSERLSAALRETAESIGPDATFRSVYENARELELKSIDFYQSEGEKVGDHRIAEAFHFLASVEQTHLEVLDTVLAATEGGS
jgi:rubrerythrin